MYLKNFLKNVKDFNKEDLLKKLEYIENTLNKDYFKSLEEWSESFKKIGVELTDSEVSTIKFINNNLDKSIKARTVFGFIDNVIKTLKDISKSLSYLKLSVEEVPEGVVKENMSVKELYLIKIIKDYIFMINYSQDLALYSVNRVGEAFLTRIFKDMRRQNIVSLSKNYAEALNSYSRVDKLPKELDSLSSERINFNSDINMIEKILTKNKMNFTYSGFVGNPFYHIGILYQDLMYKRYEANKEKIVLLNNKIIKLRLKKIDGEDNGKIDKIIENYTEQIEKLEYKIATYEEN